MRHPQKILLVTASLLLVCAALVSCASTKSKFSGQRRADLRSFSDQTSALLGEFSPDLTSLSLIRLRDLVEPSAQEETHLRELTTRAREGRVFVIGFSLRLSSMPSKASEKEQVAYFADLIDEVAEFMDSRGNLAENMREVPAAVREQPDVRRAAQASIPLVQGGMDIGVASLDQIDEALGALVNKLERKIDERYAVTLNRARKLQASREDLLNAVEDVSRARRGDEGARASLSENETVAFVGGIPEGEDVLQQLMELLIVRAEWVERVKDLIKDDLEAYRQDHAELDRVHIEMRRRLNSERVHQIIWMLGYDRMAMGVVSPAEWFDAKKTPALLLNTILP